MNLTMSGELTTSTTTYIPIPYKKQHRSKPPPPPRHRKPTLRPSAPPTKSKSTSPSPNISHSLHSRTNIIQHPHIHDQHHQKLNSSSSIHSIHSLRSTHSYNSSNSNISSNSSSSTSSFSFKLPPLPAPRQQPSTLIATKSQTLTRSTSARDHNHNLQKALKSPNASSTHSLPALPDSLPSPKHIQHLNRDKPQTFQHLSTPTKQQRDRAPIHIIQSNIASPKGEAFELSPRTPTTPPVRTYNSTRTRAMNTRTSRSSSTSSNSSNYSNYSYYHRKSSASSSHSHSRRNLTKGDGRGRDLYCICGRKMDYTQNPMDAYPPNAVLYCQQSTRCKKKIVIAKDWFYCCRARTSYHGTKDGKFKCCYSCSISSAAKQERIRKNHQLLIKQLKNNHRGKVLITKDTKDYILSSTSSNSKDETLRLLKQTYIDQDDVKKQVFGDKNNKNNKSIAIGNKAKKSEEWMTINGVGVKVIKQGFMMKKGNIWNKAFKKRYFKLLENQFLYYYKSYINGIGASDERGYADLTVVTDMIKKGKNGMEVTTPSREWKFLCTNSLERDEWYQVICDLCVGKRRKSMLKKSKTYTSINPMVASKFGGGDGKKRRNKKINKKRDNMRKIQSESTLRDDNKHRYDHKTVARNDNLIKTVSYQ